MPELEVFFVAALVVSGQGLILSVSRKDDPEDYGMPGGKLIGPENPIAGIVRETYEETRLWILDPEILFTDVDDHGHYGVTYRVRHWVSEKSEHGFIWLDTGQVPGEGVARWVEPSEFIEKSKSFRQYNERVLQAAGIRY